MKGLQARIADAIGCKGRYGAFEKYLHRNLLWHASDVNVQKIEHKSYVPSWSWMAYDGGVHFLGNTEIPFDGVQWIAGLRFDEHCEHALIADVGKFQDYTMESDGICNVILDRYGRRGWIRYDVNDGKNTVEEHCVVVVGSTGNSEDSEDSEDYYILLVRPTTVDGEYERTGIGKVPKNCLMRTRANVRVV